MRCFAQSSFRSAPSSIARTGRGEPSDEGLEREQPRAATGGGEVSAHVFGQIDEAPALEVTVTSKAGATANILTWGAVLRDLVVPSSRGPQRVTLGLNTLSDYVAYSPHFGAVPG